MIRELRKTDNLKEFFLSLSKESVYYWNRFGDVRDERIAEKAANEQLNKPIQEEKGFVVLDNGEIIGYGFLRYFPDKKQKRYTVSLGIVVSDKSQGKGIGKNLMDYMIEQAKKDSIKKIWLGVYSDNERAVKFYQKLGFEIEGIFMHDEYFDNKPRHVISMALFLEDLKSKELREKLWKSIL
jgi:ribosomal protein S18 acetylase RimI-like enzyme